MKKYYFLSILCLFCAAVDADFDAADVMLHPNAPGSGPFILEVAGTWPNDCHPGEQKPVVGAHDAASVAITFEIIVEHVTCNAMPTPYRVLVDLSGLAGTFTANSLSVELAFGGASREWTVPLRCTLEAHPGTCLAGRPVRRSVQPDSGLYFTSGLEKQGLLLARQHRALAAYPLVYDESGRAQWLFSGELILGDTYFAELQEFSGGQCLECPPPAAPAHSSTAGRVAMLFDAPHRVQVGFNGQPFMTFHALNFGYGSVEPGDGGDGMVDLSGKWAVSWHHPPYDLPGGSVPPGEPLVFELWRLAPEDGAAGNPSYVAVDLAGREMAQISCDFAATDNACVWHKAPGFWESAYWDYGDGDDIPLTILSHRRIGYVLVGEDAVVKAEAVRID